MKKIFINTIKDCNNGNFVVVQTIKMDAEDEEEYRTIVIHPNFNGGDTIILAINYDISDAIKDHQRWIKEISHTSVRFLTDVYEEKDYYRKR